MVSSFLPFLDKRFGRILLSLPLYSVASSSGLVRPSICLRREGVESADL